MAAEYLANAPQDVANGGPVIFTASIPCTRGWVYHEDETGIFILRGIANNQCFATYQITFNGNIGLPDGATVPAGGIAIALAINGEPRPTSRAIFVPAAAGTDFGNVTATAIVKVPRGCCFSLAVEAVPASADPTVTPAPVITVQNANLTVARIA